MKIAWFYSSLIWTGTLYADPESHATRLEMNFLTLLISINSLKILSLADPLSHLPDSVIFYEVQDAIKVCSEINVNAPKGLQNLAGL